MPNISITILQYRSKFSDSEPLPPLAREKSNKVLEMFLVKGWDALPIHKLPKRF